jgi:CRP-like cAMP-binding protein
MNPYEQFRQQFRQLPVQWGEELDELIGAFVLEHYKPGQVYQDFGQRKLKVGYIISGLLRYYIIAGDEDKTVFFFAEGQYVADMHSLVNDLPSQCCMEAMEPLDILVIPYSDLKALYDKYLSINKAGRLIYERMLAEVETRLFSHLKDSPEKRYLDLLENTPDLFQRIPQHILASFLGVTPISLSRIKKRVYEKRLGE